MTNSNRKGNAMKNEAELVALDTLARSLDSLARATAGRSADSKAHEAFEATCAAILEVTPMVVASLNP